MGWGHVAADSMMAGLAILLYAVLFAWPRIAEEGTYPLWLRNADLHRAARHAVGAVATGPPWYVAGLILAMAAGLAWTAAFLARSEPRAG